MTSYRIPARLTKIGTVLDATLEHGGKRIFLRSEWKGFQLLTDPDAFERADGRARLFLVRGQLTGLRALREPEKGTEAYERWHKRDPEQVGELDVPESCDYPQGRMTQLGYKSDKWSGRGRSADYDHDFRESGKPPLVYTDTPTLGRAKCIVVVGGSMRVTEGGID